MRMVTVLALAAALALPAGVGAQQVDGWIRISVFHPDLFTASVIVDWYGIGGTQQEPSGFVTGDIPGNADESPDDCLDNDGQGQVWGNQHLTTVSVGFRVIKQEPTTLVPGNSVAAPAELVALCSVVRENLFGQPLGYEYASGDQSVGHGDVMFEASSFGLPSGFMVDNDLVAQPSTFQARSCTVDLDTFEGTAPSDADDEQAGLAFQNGVLFAEVSDCLDIGTEMVEFLEAGNPNEPDQWDPGTINRQGGTVIWDLDLFTHVSGFGLHVVCFKANVFDAANAAVGVFEDYGWFWVDGPDNAFALAPQYAVRENHDGQAHNGDCASLGIPL